MKLKSAAGHLSFEWRSDEGGPENLVDRELSF